MVATVERRKRFGSSFFPNLQLVQVFDPPPPPEIELLPSTASYVILSPPAGLDPVADKTRQKCSELSVFISEIPWREFKPRRPNASIDMLLLQRLGILMVSPQPKQSLQSGMLSENHGVT